MNRLVRFCSEGTRLFHIRIVWRAINYYASIISLFHVCLSSIGISSLNLVCFVTIRLCWLLLVINSKSNIILMLEHLNLNRHLQRIDLNPVVNQLGRFARRVRPCLVPWLPVMVPGSHVGARARGRYLVDVTRDVPVRIRSPRPTTRYQEMLKYERCFSEREM